MAALSTYLGSGTSLSTNYYMRNFYAANRDARTSSKRRDMNHSTLSMADGAALRRAVKELANMEFSEEKATDTRCAVKAYIETFNNAISSAADSGDRTLERNMKQLKSLAKEYSSKLDKIGITVNDDGTLTRRDSLFGSADIKKFEELFSNHSDFMQRSSACAKRIERRGEALVTTENYLMTNKNATDSTSKEATAVAELFSDGTDLDTVLNTGLGQNINISL